MKLLDLGFEFEDLGCFLRENQLNFLLFPFETSLFIRAAHLYLIHIKLNLPFLALQTLYRASHFANLGFRGFPKAIFLCKLLESVNFVSESPVFLLDIDVILRDFVLIQRGFW